MMTQTASTDITALFPTDILGEEYFITREWVSIIATEDSAYIDITSPSGIHDTIFLRLGEFYYGLRTFGTSVESILYNGSIPKKIAVFAGHEKTRGDKLLDQMVPGSGWGKEFVMNPDISFKANPIDVRNVMQARVFSKTNNTNIAYTHGGVTENFTLHRGQDSALIIDTASYISADNPIFVSGEISYNGASELDMPITWGHGALWTIFPISHATKSFTFIHIPRAFDFLASDCKLHSRALWNNHLKITAKTVDTSNIWFNGSQLSNWVVNTANPDFADKATEQAGYDGFNPFPNKIYSTGGSFRIVVFSADFAYRSTYGMGGLAVLGQTSNDSNICVGDSITLSPISLSGMPPFTYQWTSIPAGTFEMDSLITVSPDTTTQYIVEITDFNSLVNIDTINVIVNPLPTVLINPDKNPVCEGENINVTATGGITYLWSTGETNSTFNTSLTTDSVYWVSATNIEGCSDSTSMLIQVADSINAGIIPPTDSICVNGSTLDLSAIVDGIGTWSGDGIIDTVDGILDPSLLSASTSYYIYYTIDSTCMSKDSILITAYSAPLINIQPIDTTIARGDSISLSTICNPTYSYLWNSTLIPSDNNLCSLLIFPLEQTDYTLIVTDTITGCINNGSVSVYVDDIELIIYNTITPNGDGINDIWTILNLEKYPDHEVDVYNRAGSLVYSAKPYNSTWDGKYNNKPLPTGTYYYVIRLNNEKGNVEFGSVSILK
jgi:gliding motility-associated-like protein